MKKAFIKGYKAAIAGAGGMSNPYCLGTIQHKHYAKGWITGFKETNLKNGKPSKRIPKSF